MNKLPTTSPASDHHAVDDAVAADTVDTNRRAQLLSTEHWSLLATRSMSWNEAFSRTGMFLSTLSAATVASWARYAEGVDEQGEPIDVEDQLADTLVPLARSQHENPTAFIENTAVFGDLATDRRFVDAYLFALDTLHSDGARTPLESLLREDGTS